MFRHVFASAMVVFLIASFAAATTKQEREKGERPAQKQASEKATPDPESKSLKSSDDPGFAETEEGCAGARVLDYLRRHGNDGGAAERGEIATRARPEGRARVGDVIPRHGAVCSHRAVSTQ